MKKKTMEEIIKSKNYFFNDDNDMIIQKRFVIEIMTEWGEQQRKQGFAEGRDKALQWAVENYDYKYDTWEILSGKTAKELQP